MGAAVPVSARPSARDRDGGDRAAPCSVWRRPSTSRRRRRRVPRSGAPRRERPARRPLGRRGVSHALQVAGAVLHARPLCGDCPALPAPGRRRRRSTRPSPTRTSSAGSSCQRRAGVIRDANGKVLASSAPIVRRRGHPCPCDAERTARALPRRPARSSRDPDSLPKLADILRLNPEERRTLEARIHAACASDDDKSPCWTRRILVREDVPRDIVSELKQHTDELAGVDVEPACRCASTRSRSSAPTCSATSPRSTPRRSQAMSPRASTSCRRRSSSGSTRSATRRAIASVPRASSARGSRTCGGSAAGRRGWSMRTGATRSGPDAERLVDAPGRLDPIPGRDLRLSVDLELEQAIEKAMRPHAAGAVVAVDVRTGRLLALYSKPGFDPNELSGGEGRARTREAFNRLYADPLRPMLDKTMSGAFQPGSTMKPFSALAALEDHMVDPDHTEKCEGFLTFGHRVFRCTHAPRHGEPRAGDRAVVQRVLLPPRRDRRDGSHRAGRAGVRPGSEDGARDQPRGAGPHPHAIVVRPALPRAVPRWASR